MGLGRWQLVFSAQVRDARLRERLASRLDEAAHDATVDGGAARICLIAAVLRSPMALPVDGVRAARDWLRDPSGLDVEDVEDVEMHGRRPAARAIAAGRIACDGCPTPRSANP